MTRLSLHHHRHRCYELQHHPPGRQPGQVMTECCLPLPVQGWQTPVGKASAFPAFLA